MGKGRHRFSEEEANAAFETLTQEEKEEYNAILLTGGMSTASNERLAKLETIGYTRLKEKNIG